MKKTPAFLVALACLLACMQENKSAAATSFATPTLASPEAKPAALTQNSKSLAVGDTLYVHAMSGLVLRKTPSKDGEKIASAPYASAVRIIALPDPANRYVAERIGSFELSGGWVKVKTGNGQVGYLFEGYLLPYAPHIESSEEGFYDAEWFYLSTFAGARLELPLSEEEGLIEHFKRRYVDGAEFEHQGFNGGTIQYLYLPPGKFTLQQALILGRNLFFSTSDDKGNIILLKTKATYDAAQQLLTVKNTDGYEQLTIQLKDGRLVLCSSSAD